MSDNNLSVTSDSSSEAHRHPLHRPHPTEPTAHTHADPATPPVPVSTDAAPFEISPTAMDTHERDVLGLGRTSGQRTAEVFAGLRAELMPGPESTALSRMSGRITARLLSSLGSKKVLNFVPVRLGTFTGLIKQHLGSQISGKVLVEIAAGFSPRGLMLARAIPELQVIEIDLPDVVQEKKRRLEKGNIEIPANIQWKSADLGVQPLDEVLDLQRVDIVTAEGLMPYFEYSDITRIAHHIYQSLKMGGVLIADLGYTTNEGTKEANRIVSVFRRYTASAPGSVNDENTAYQLFKDAGYEQVDLYRMPQTAEMFDLPRPVSDVLFFMVSHRQKA